MKANLLKIGLVSLSFNVFMLLPTMAESGKAQEPVSSTDSSDVIEPSKSDIQDSSDRGLFIDPIRAKRDKAKAKASSAKTATVKSGTKEKAKVKSAVVQRTKSVTKTQSVKAKPKAAPQTKVGSAKTLPQAKLAKKPLLVVSNGNVVAASLNKAGKVPHYADGENLRVTVKAYEDCNLMIFNYDGKVLTQLFPNQFQRDSLIKAGARLEIGGEESKFDFLASNDTKESSSEKIFVYAYPVKAEKRPISIAMHKVPSSPFRSTQMTLEEYRKLVNSSKTFFERGVKVRPKSDVKLTAYAEEDIEPSSLSSPNKLELSLVVDKR